MIISPQAGEGWGSIATENQEREGGDMSLSERKDGMSLEGRGIQDHYIDAAPG